MKDGRAIFGRRVIARHARIVHASGAPAGIMDIERCDSGDDGTAGIAFAGDPDAKEMHWPSDSFQPGDVGRVEGGGSLDRCHRARQCSGAALRERSALRDPGAGR